MDKKAIYFVLFGLSVFAMFLNMRDFNAFSGWFCSAVANYSLATKS